MSLSRCAAIIATAWIVTAAAGQRPPDLGSTAPGADGRAEGPCPAEGDCCEDHGMPGCSDAACCMLVCGLDPFCCDVAWDFICALAAEDLCELCVGGGGDECGPGTPPACGPGAGSCCSADGTPGCDDCECCTFICSFDPFCCDVAWDGICVNAGQEFCGLICKKFVCPGFGDCCEPSGFPGCNVEACCMEVCEQDPFCCVAGWDAICVDIAEDLCGSLCTVACDGSGKCPPDAGQEGEPCGSATNEGCNSGLEVFTPAACGTTFCGTAWADDGSRDTDWYLVAHAGGPLSATLTSEFPGVCFIVDGIDTCDPVVAGQIGCSENGLPLADAIADLPPGVYAIFVATGECDGSGIFSGLACDNGCNGYVVEINCAPVACGGDGDCPPGLFCNGGTCGPPCFTVTGEEITCHEGTGGFTYTIEGIGACGGGPSTYAFTAAGGAAGQQMCFTLLVTGEQGGQCCTVERCVTVPDCSCGSAKLVGSGALPADRLGWSIAAADDRIVAGANQFFGPDDGPGKAVVFRREGTGWIEEAQLTAGDGEPGDAFGESVAISGDRVIVGAPFGGGAAYVFRIQGTAWSQEAMLVPSDSTGSFGSSAALSGNRALVGAMTDSDVAPAAGAAYVFRREGTHWIQEQKLTPSDGEAGDFFGSAVSISADVAIVAGHESDSPLSSGTAYIYRLVGSVWVEEAVLFSDGSPEDEFGRSVSIHNDLAMVGAPNEGAVGHFDGHGSAFVYRHEGSSWVQEAKLTPVLPAQDYLFGADVSVRGQRCLVGAPGAVVAGDQVGTAYLYRRQGGSWEILSAIVPTEETGSLGFAVSLSSQVASAGAPSDDEGCADIPSCSSGAAFVLLLGADCDGGGPIVPEDLDGDGAVGVTDLLALLEDWGSCSACSACPADLDQNCSVDVGDLLALLASWG